MDADAADRAFAATVARARMQPLLPCGDVDEIADFWTALGLERRYRQIRPNPYLVMSAGGFELHYYGMPEWNPDESHSTCMVLVPDPRPLHERFRAGLRDRYGRVPNSGAPRITRPRERANNGGLSGFSLIDPAGNWVRVTRAPDGEPDAGDGERTTWTSTAGSPLGRALENAVVIGDSHGDPVQARRVLDGALRRSDETASAEGGTEDRARALAYLIELDLRLDDRAAADARIAELERMPLDDAGVVEASLIAARDAIADAEG
ncbi:hypothetical protein [Agromyces sp. LHK192]|uniref:hypothetical protein n=1 Tax=Agromyces sp. LHK192 TaxID=2498704 RepID=UPI00196A8200|nr:hypothetical protein [Agromyces sp. LHK192]